MRTWGKCPTCGQLVRVRKDNGRMWVHIRPRANYYYRFPFWLRCLASKELPEYTVEREYRRVPAFTPRQETTDDIRKADGDEHGVAVGRQ